jgi:hypothetical protein
MSVGEGDYLFGRPARSFADEDGLEWSMAWLGRHDADV